MRDHSLEPAALGDGTDEHRTSGSLLDRLIARFARSRLDRLAFIGGLVVVLPSGVAIQVGRPGPGDARVRLFSHRPVWSGLRRGALGFAESFLAGECAVDNLTSLFDFFIVNKDALEEAGGGWLRADKRDRAFHFSRENTRSGSRRNIAEHYDLGNPFYRLWLDAGMQYSSGIYRGASDTLEVAQRVKLDRVMASLDVRPSDTVLEIGCGWGAVLEEVARAGAHAVGLTLSEEQARFARARLAGVPGGAEVDIRLQDYRDVDGQFDRIVSIEMIEAVGEKYWPTYFQTLRRALKPDGHAVIQAITIRPSSFVAYRREPDFIQRYVFPGGMLPTVPLMRVEARRAGLDFETIESFGTSYAQTLRDWRERFEACWPKIEKLGFDDRFRRLWLYYLTYCEAGFDGGVIDVGLYKLRPIG